MISGLLVFSPFVKALYPGWYLLGHSAVTSLMMGAL